MKKISENFSFKKLMRTEFKDGVNTQKLLTKSLDFQETVAVGS